MTSRAAASATNFPVPAAAHRRLSSLYRTAFVSGASTGLGQAFAQMLLAEGVDVWGSARDVARLAHLSTELSGNATNAGVVPNADTAKTAAANSDAIEGDSPRGGLGKFTPVALDLADGAEAERIFRAAAAQAGGDRCGNAGGDRCGSAGGGQCESAAGFDIVINNAGYSVFGDFAATDFAHWQRQIEVMLVNTARLAHTALADWRVHEAAAQGLHEAGTGASPRSRVLVNVSSLAAEFPLPYQTSYNIVKAGLTALSESLMIETAGTSVSVIDLRPGDYRTDFARSVLYPGEQLEESHSDAGATTPRQIGQPAAVLPSEARKIEQSKTAAWEGFERMMQSGPPPEHAARALRRALLRRRSATLRCGRFFQAVLAPLLARFGSLALKRRVQARYFNL